MSCSRTTATTVHDEPPVGTRERKTPATYAASVNQDPKTFSKPPCTFPIRKIPGQLNHYSTSVIPTITITTLTKQ